MAEADEELLAIDDDAPSAPGDLSLLPADSELAVRSFIIKSRRCMQSSQQQQEMEAAAAEPAAAELAVEQAAEDPIEAEDRRLQVR